jgi:hypothetical protein
MTTILNEKDFWAEISICFDIKTKQVGLDPQKLKQH